MIGCFLDIEACASGAFDGFVTWALSFISFNTLVMLWIGTAIGAKWGWPALIAETLGIFAFLYKSRAPGETHEHVSGKDAAPVARPRTGTSKAKPAKSTRSGTLADFFKGLGK
jgi:hypothetical protein